MCVRVMYACLLMQQERIDTLVREALTQTMLTAQWSAEHDVHAGDSNFVYSSKHSNSYSSNSNE